MTTGKEILKDAQTMSTADFMNMFLVLHAVNVDPVNLQVMLFDNHPDGTFFLLLNIL